MSRLLFVLLALLYQNSALASEPLDTRLQRATEQAKRLIQTAVIDTSKHYCLKGSMTCRSIFTYKTKSGIKLKHFTQVFMSSDRQVGSSGYFFPDLKKTGQYARYEDMNFDGKIQFNESLDPIIVHRAADNSVERMLGLRLNVMGTSQYVLTDLIFDEKMAVIEGTKLDSNRPDFKEPVRIEYFRIYP